MATFQYRAARISGEVVEGRLDAGSQAEAVHELNDMGLIPIRAEEIGAQPRGAWLDIELFRRDRVSPRQIMIVTRALATLLQSGIELERALQIAATMVEGEGVRRLFETVLADVRAGRSLADALETQADKLPPSYVSMVRAGEAGGALDVVFGRIAEFLERSHAAREKLRSALIYPILLVVMAVASVIVMVTVVLPQFEPLFADAGRKLPLLTRIMLAISHGVGDYGLFVLAALAIGWLVFRRRMRDPAARLRFDRAALGAPVLGAVLLRLDVVRLCRTLGTLLQNGVATLPALQIASATLVNTALAAGVTSAAEKVRSGRAISEAFHEVPALPDLAARMIAIGEETGRLTQMLLRVADIYDDEAQRAIERLLTLLLPALTALLGLFIALIIGSVFLAIVSVNELAI